MQLSWSDIEHCDVSELEGKTLVSVYKEDDYDGDQLHFITDANEHYVMYHSQDCCESVYIEDITGDLEDLIGQPIEMAQEESSDLPPLYQHEESYTWTFYKFATLNGYVNIRWYGTSNGYYSESVSFGKCKKS